MEFLKVIAFTHKQIDLKHLGKLVICDKDYLHQKLQKVKDELQILEIFYLATCNRVEFVFTTGKELDTTFVTKFLNTLELGIESNLMTEFVNNVSLFKNHEALNHLLRISCSLESLVVGEKEILAQVRKSYEECRDAGFTGDLLRVIMDRVVKTSKEVYTQTNISRNPISVVSLAHRSMMEREIPENARILILGAGETNVNFAHYLKSLPQAQFTVYNRTLSKAENLADTLGGRAFELSQLEQHKEGFDVLITCVGSDDFLIDEKLFLHLAQNEQDTKIIIDLAVPNNVTSKVASFSQIHYIEVNSLKELAKKNIEERYKELSSAEKIIAQNTEEFVQVLRQRKVELAMRAVPEKIKEIKIKALESVFQDEVNQLDDHAKEVLTKVIDYMEKKYISVPMIMAKDILVSIS